MERYANTSGESGVSAYEIFPQAIVVRFHHGGTYRYDQGNPGKRRVAAMKKLARAGAGLATYINRHVRENYAAKLED